MKVLLILVSASNSDDFSMTKVNPCYSRTHMYLSNIPKDIRATSRFALRDAEGRPHTKEGKPASPKERDAWIDFHTIKAIAENSNQDELVWLCEPPFFVIDLDDEVDPITGKLSLIAEELLSNADTYTERSRSGKGFHIIGKGIHPAFYDVDNSGFQEKIELYTRKMITLTGEVYKNRSEVKECPELLSSQVERYKPSWRDSFAKTYEEESCEGDSPLTDAEIIQRVIAKHPYFNIANRHDNSSKKDYSVACSLMFWTSRDKTRARMLFQASPRVRGRLQDKGQKHFDTAIEDAYADCKRWYQPKQRQSVEVTESKSAGRLSEIYTWIMSDTGNAELLISKYGDEIRYAVESQCWYVWNGKVWERDASSDLVQSRMKNAIRSCWSMIEQCSDTHERDTLYKFLRQSESDYGIRAAVSRARVEPSIRVSSAVFDTHGYYFNVANGTIDLRDGSLLAHTRNHYLTKIVDIAYDPNAVCPVWEKFLMDCVSGEQDYADYLQRAVGATIRGDNRKEVLFIIQGEGGTGKGTFIRTMSHLLGGASNYAVTVSMATLTEVKRKGSAPAADILRMKAPAWLRLTNQTKVSG